MVDNMLIKGCFIIEGSDKALVDLYCEKDYFKICVIRREPIVKSRKIAKPFDTFISRIVLERKKYLECRIIKINPKNISFKRKKKINDKIYYIIESKESPNIIIFVPYNKIEFLKKCLSQYND